MDVRSLLRVGDGPAVMLGGWCVPVPGKNGSLDGSCRPSRWFLLTINAGASLVEAWMATVPSAEPCSKGECRIVIGGPLVVVHIRRG